MVVRVKGGMSEWVDGLKEGSGPLAKASDSRSEAAGKVMRGMGTGAAAGAAVGIASALVPGGLSHKATGIAALVAGGVAVATAHTGLGGIARDAAIGLSAIAGRDFAEGMTASKAGTAAQVLQSKAASLAAHGESIGGDGAEDPLLAVIRTA
jgi:hypothetical protein